MTIESPGLRQLPAGSPQQAAESSSLDYGLVVLLQLLATPSREDAVTFRYRVQNQTLERTYTSQIQRARRRTSRHTPGAVRHTNELFSSTTADGTRSVPATFRTRFFSGRLLSTAGIVCFRWDFSERLKAFSLRGPVLLQSGLAQGVNTLAGWSNRSPIDRRPLSGFAMKDVAEVFFRSESGLAGDGGESEVGFSEKLL